MPLSKSQAKLLDKNPLVGTNFQLGGWKIGGVTVTTSAADLNQLAGKDALIDTGNTGASLLASGTIEVKIGGVSHYLLERGSP
jgi:hypothetical protein